MSIVTRLIFVSQALMAVLGVAILYASAGRKVIKLAGSGGKLSGPFSDVIDNIDTVLPALLGVFVVVLAIYLIVGGLTTERSTSEERRRRPP